MDGPYYFPTIDVRALSPQSASVYYLEELGPPVSRWLYHFTFRGLRYVHTD
jgi:hypothetical protein